MRETFFKKAWKREAYEKALDDVEDLKDAGHDVYKFTDWHWKIDGIDVWPSSKKFSKNGTVSRYENLRDILK